MSITKIVYLGLIVSFVIGINVGIGLSYFIN